MYFAEKYSEVEKVIFSKCFQTFGPVLYILKEKITPLAIQQLTKKKTKKFQSRHRHLNKKNYKEN